MGTILLFIIVLSLLVFVHELGHFLIAKKMKMRVEEFGFGFPPRLFGIKKGQTTYSINWIPLGGFVRIKGESGDHKDHEDSFASKTVWQRFIVLVAGVVMNLFLAGVLLSIGFMIGLPSIINEHLPASARITDQQIGVMTVWQNSPAEKAGIEIGETIVSINEKTFVSSDDAREFIKLKGEEEISLLVKDSNEKARIVLLNSESLENTEISGVGLGLATVGRVSFSPGRAVLQGFEATAQYTVQIVLAFYDLIKGLILGQGTTIDLSGPVGIAVLTGEVAALGFVYLLQFTALLSINLAIINIFPFPALDGGRLLFLAIEKLRGKAVDEKLEAVVHNLGFAFLMILVILVTYRDIINFF